MKRRRFLQMLGFGAAAVVVAPALPAPAHPVAVEPPKPYSPDLPLGGFELMKWIEDPDCPPDRLYFSNLSNMRRLPDGTFGVMPGTEGQFAMITGARYIT